MKLHLGSGSARIEGFINVDIRKEPEVDIIGHVGSLPTIKDGSVETIFGHAVFEHVFIGHQLATLREWKRVLAMNGRAIMLALPDFRMLADLYLKGARGIVGDRFDLQNVYRYTHGEPEHSSQPVWPVWQPSPGDDAPAGWVPQVHKSLFDAGYLHDLLKQAGFSALVFNYAYPGEEHPVNLGFIATLSPLKGDPLAGIRDSLACVPGVERWINKETISVADGARADGLVAYAIELDTNRPEAFSAKVARRISRMLCRA